MPTEQDKAVALAEKHGACFDPKDTYSHRFGMNLDELVAMLAERDKQHTEELAQRSGVMPLVWRADGMCSSDEVREALAQMQARVEQLEKDAARYQYLKEHHSYNYPMQPDSHAEHGIEYQWQQGSYEERNQGLDGSIDAAMKKESGK